MSRHLDLYAAERRASQVAYVLALIVTRRAVLGWYWLGDARRIVRRSR